MVLKKNIDISEVDLPSFMGVGDQNINTIQENVDTQIVVRGSTIHLNGTKDEISLIESVVNEMMLAINQKGYIEPSAIHRYLSSLSSEEKDKLLASIYLAEFKTATCCLLSICLPCKDAARLASVV